jgi:predicted kinase
VMEPRIYWELTMLIILGGLPGTGKTTIARELARQLGAVHVRIDSIEEAILDSGVLSSQINDAGYRVGYAVAADNLRIGRTVIADSVNPIPLSRDAWVEVASRAQVSAVEIEIICSDTKEHQHRVETRISDIARSRSLSWQEVISRDYRPWRGEHIVIDTASRTVEQVVTILRGAISNDAAGIVVQMLERKLKTIPIKELARQTGVDRNAIRRVLRGERVHSKTQTKLLKAVAKFSKG